MCPSALGRLVVALPAPRGRGGPQLRVPPGWDVPGGVGRSTAALLGAPRRGPPKGRAPVYVARTSFGFGKAGLDVLDCCRSRPDELCCLACASWPPPAIPKLPYLTGTSKASARRALGSSWVRAQHPSYCRSPPASRTPAPRTPFTAAPIQRRKEKKKKRFLVFKEELMLAAFRES